MRTGGQTAQAKNLSEKEEMSTDWLLKYRKERVSTVTRTTYDRRNIGKKPSATRVYNTYIAKYFTRYSSIERSLGMLKLAKNYITKVQKS